MKQARKVEKSRSITEYALTPDFSVGFGGGWSGLDGAEWIPDSDVVGPGLEGTVGGGPSGKIPNLSAVLLNPTNFKPGGVTNTSSSEGFSQRKLSLRTKESDTKGTVF